MLILPDIYKKKLNKTEKLQIADYDNTGDTLAQDIFLTISPNLKSLYLVFGITFYFFASRFTIFIGVHKIFYRNGLFVYVGIAVIIGPEYVGGSGQTLYSLVINELLGISCKRAASRWLRHRSICFHKCFMKL